MTRMDKLLERAAAALAGRTPAVTTVVYADGSTRSFTNIIEIIEEVTSRAEEDIVDVLNQDGTTCSLFMAMRGPWDFSDLEELVGQ